MPAHKKLKNDFKPNAGKIAQALTILNNPAKPHAFVLFVDANETAQAGPIVAEVLGAIKTVAPLIEDSAFVSGKWPAGEALAPVAHGIAYLAAETKNSRNYRHFVIVGDGAVSDFAAALESFETLLSDTGVSLDFAVIGNTRGAKTPLQKFAEKLMEKRPAAVGFTRGGGDKLVQLLDDRRTEGRVRFDYKGPGSDL